MPGKKEKHLARQREAEQVLLGHANASSSVAKGSWLPASRTENGANTNLAAAVFEPTVSQ
jgi:hypothetical protein